MRKLIRGASAILLIPSLLFTTSLWAIDPDGVINGTGGNPLLTVTVQSWNGDVAESVDIQSTHSGETIHVTIDPLVWANTVVTPLGPDEEGWDTYQISVPTAEGTTEFLYRQHTDAQGVSRFTIGHFIINTVGFSGTFGGAKPMVWPIVIGLIACLIMEDLNQEKCKDRAVETCGAGQVKSVEASSKCGFNSSCKYECK